MHYVTHETMLQKLSNGPSFVHLSTPQRNRQEILLLNLMTAVNYCGQKDLLCQVILCGNPADDKNNWRKITAEYNSLI